MDRGSGCAVVVNALTCSCSPPPYRGGFDARTSKGERPRQAGSQVAWGATFWTASPAEAFPTRGRAAAAGEAHPLLLLLGFSLRDSLRDGLEPDADESYPSGEVTTANHRSHVHGSSSIGSHQRPLYGAYYAVRLICSLRKLKADTALRQLLWIPRFARHCQVS